MTSRGHLAAEHACSFVLTLLKPTAANMEFTPFRQIGKYQDLPLRLIQFTQRLTELHVRLAGGGWILEMLAQGLGQVRGEQVECKERCAQVAKARFPFLTMRCGMPSAPPMHAKVRDFMDKRQQEQERVDVGVYGDPGRPSRPGGEVAEFSDAGAPEHEMERVLLPEVKAVCRGAGGHVLFEYRE